MAESVWRQKAINHQQRILSLLRPGLLNDSSSSSSYRINSEHPVYNFFEEYYGIKGSKGVRKLMRWSPPMMTLLEGAKPEDLGTGLLHLRGAQLVSKGVIYDPRQFFMEKAAALEESRSAASLASPFMWYRNILASTQRNDPIMYCYGLHEWSMQYRPEGSPPPVSGQYQKHLPLRVDQATINETVERRGTSCTHVDALRFFAPEALPLNSKQLERKDQMYFEQPGCVHAHMDLFKISLRLSPWIDSQFIADAIEVGLEARKLDVAASPYDTSSYGIVPICIETAEGRAAYRKNQERVLNKSVPVRKNILEAYDTFLNYAFNEDSLMDSTNFLPGRPEIIDKKGEIYQPS